MLFVSGPLLKLDANIEIGRRDRAYAGNQSELLLVICRWNVHILQPTKLFQDAFDSLGWVNKLGPYSWQSGEGGAIPDQVMAPRGWTATRCRRFMKIGSLTVGLVQIRWRQSPAQC